MGQLGNALGVHWVHLEPVEPNARGFYQAQLVPWITQCKWAEYLQLKNAVMFQEIQARFLEPRSRNCMEVYDFVEIRFGKLTF